MHLLFYIIAIYAISPSLIKAMADVAPVCRHDDQHL